MIFKHAQVNFPFSTTDRRSKMKSASYREVVPYRDSIHDTPGTDLGVHAIRQSLIKLNHGLEERVDELIAECGPRPAYHGAMWVRDIVKKTDKADRDVVLVAIMATCQGLRWLAHQQMSDDPKDYERILNYHFGSTPWTVTPFKMGVVIGMIKAGSFVADCWDITDTRHMGDGENGSQSNHDPIDVEKSNRKAP